MPEIRPVKHPEYIKDQLLDEAKKGATDAEKVQYVMDRLKPVLGKALKRLEFVDSFLEDIDQYLTANPDLKADIKDYVRPEIRKFLDEIPKDLI